MKTKQELFGGPLDGAEVDVPAGMQEGWEIEMDLVSEEYTPELRTTVTKIRNAKVVHVMRDGVLEFKEQRD